MQHLKILLFLMTLLGLLHWIHPQEDQFREWMHRHGKTYHGQQLAYRRQIFQRNLQQIDNHNQLYAKGVYSYTLGVNKFADLTDQEWKMVNSIPKRNLDLTTRCKVDIDDTPNPPDQVDWTKKAMTPPKDQGSCGAGWAFAAIGSLEGLYAQRKGKLLQLSVQQLLSCSSSYGNDGCSGGIMDQALWYVIDNGITSNDSYPYIADTKPCSYKPASKVMEITNCALLPSGNHNKLISAVIQQPVAGAVESSKFKLYKDGVFDGDCTTDIDAGILIVGYGKTDDGVDYWRIKNSLGTDWGMNGMMLLAMGDKTDGAGKCGIQLLSALPRDMV